METPMATTPPINSKPEPKHYLWMGIISLVFVVLALFLPQRVLPFPAALFLLVLAFILALISLKMRRKTFPIIVIILILVSAIPFCCVGGGSAFLRGVDILQGNNPVFAPKPKVEWDSVPAAACIGGVAVQAEAVTGIAFPGLVFLRHPNAPILSNIAT
jgi:hypothetical protein